MAPLQPLFQLLLVSLFCSSVDSAGGSLYLFWQPAVQAQESATCWQLEGFLHSDRSDIQWGYCNPRFISAGLIRGFTPKQNVQGFINPGLTLRIYMFVLDILCGAALWLIETHAIELYCLIEQFFNGSVIPMFDVKSHGFPLEFQRTTKPMSPFIC